MKLFPDVAIGDMVVYQTHENGIELTANARITSIDGDGVCNLAHFPAGVDGKTAQGQELSVPVAFVPYAQDGRRSTWHLPVEVAS